jgi:hypothetical protein
MPRLKMHGAIPALPMAGCLIKYRGKFHTLLAYFQSVENIKVGL